MTSGRPELTPQQKFDQLKDFNLNNVLFLFMC